MPTEAHTPGKWSHRQQATGTWCVEAGATIAHVYGGQKTAEERARLIAAAPALLAALQGVIRVADRKTDEFDAAHAALALATGAQS